MRLAPIGVFALTARVVAKTGFDAAGPLLVLGGLRDRGPCRSMCSSRCRC